MTRNNYRLLTVLVALLLLSLPAGALAHDGGARLELSAERTSAGASVEIRGVNIAAEQPIALALVGAGGEFSLGTVVGDEHGDFVQGVLIPREAAMGAYTVRAIGSNRVIVGAPLAIIGVAPEEGGEQRDQDEPLLAPMPQVEVAPPQRAARESQVVFAGPDTTVVSWLPTLVIVFGVVLGLFVAVRRSARMRNSVDTKSS